MKHRILRQKHIVLLIIALLVLAVSVINAIPVYAVWPADLDRTEGQIRLVMTFTGGGDTYAMNGGEMSLYTVAYAACGDTGYFFDTTSGRFAGTEAAESIPSMDTAELAEKNADLAHALAKAAGEIPADQTAAIVNGEALFSDLRPGLYLIVMTKEDETGATVSPFLISLPDGEGRYEITARPKPEIEPPPAPGTVTPEPTTTPEPTATPEPTDTPEPTGTPPVPPENVLPYTGQLWWPVPVLAAAGLMLIVLGFWLRRRGTRT